MTLTVLNVAYPLAPVGPDAVGGAEQVLMQLHAALCRSGHESIVLACEGSIVQGKLLAAARPPAALNEDARSAAHARYRAMIAGALRKWPIDLVHFHGIDFHHYLPPPGVPVLATLHLPPSWYPPEIFRLSRPQTYLVCVSASQRRRCPPATGLLPEIENGVDLKLSAGTQKKCGFVLAMGRICPEKGYHIALAAAARAAMPLLLAGEVFPYQAHQQYFEREIVPRLDRRRRFLGPIGGHKKSRLLCAARCLVAPSLVAETSSLVAMEAFACGTPVVAFPSGALADIVEHGRTGYLVRDEAEMAAAMEAAASLDPEACREAARTRFSVARTTGRYLDLYAKIVDAGMGKPQADIAGKIREELPCRSE